MAAEVTLTRACTVLFLFRALAQAEDEEEHAQLESQLLHLIDDLGGTEDTEGFILLTKSADELTALARARGLDAGLVERVRTEGAVDKVVPLYVRNTLVGILSAGVENGILAAIATLASAALETTREIEELQVRNALLEEQMETGMIGSSPVMNRLLARIERLAPQDTTVLILGESGTGKEMVARALHRSSRRSQAPFVAINCAALTPTLLESELFGHEKGAFTDAVVQKKGKLELAGGGTVFLDEIGELAHELQAKLLRVLQQREFERVGGTKTLKLDVRLVAATNRDLAADVKRGAFREDLFHRLNVVPLRTPPLRERREDILGIRPSFPGAGVGALRSPCLGNLRRRGAIPCGVRLAGERAGIGKHHGASRRTRRIGSSTARRSFRFRPGDRGSGGAGGRLSQLGRRSQARIHSARLE